MEIHDEKHKILSMQLSNRFRTKINYANREEIKRDISMNL